jgi:hypothetical protein
VVPVLDLRGESEYIKGELTYIHRSTSCGNNVHELTYSGAHVKCKANQRGWLKLSIVSGTIIRGTPKTPNLSW